MSSGDEDERTLCKYGADCYQKNPEHHKKFKHPKRKAEDEASDVEKKRKVEEESNGSVVTNPDDCLDLLDLSKLPEDDIQLKIETVFLVKMPRDFLSFYNFCESIDKNNPNVSLQIVGLRLVGPFDLISEDYQKISQGAALRHYRYYFDPPEFQTVLKCDGRNLLHYGYFRDDPKEDPVFVASNEAGVDCSLKIISENLFSAVNVHIEKEKRKSDPFRKMKIQKIQNALVEWSKKNNFTLDTVTKKMRERKSKVVAKTFHGAGIVVPYNKKTELGYRKLSEDDVTLKKILTNLVEAQIEEEKKQYWTKLQPIITSASIANDEYDFGTGLELGLDLFCFGHEILHKAVSQVLMTSYDLLGRTNFKTILAAHLKERKKGDDLNTIAF